ncbi:MAG: 6-phosphogluconolactonase [Acidobacteria bacterium]|nr:6-phosphogluconolactonase [Acidobacteriota bacterium]
MPFKVIITRDFDHMSEVAAAVVVEDIRLKLSSKPSYVLGLATGNSPTGLYKHFAKAANAGKIDSSKVISFNLDEYIGLPGENAQQRALHKESYSFFMIQELFGLLQDKFLEVNVPWGTLVDQAQFESELKSNPDDFELQGSDKGKAVVIRQDARSDYLRWIRREILDGYSNKIARCGGMDLHIIGVGGRGHVGFHEAGVPFANNRMILIKLDDNTIANAVADGHFPGKEECPLYAVSMGAELVYKAKTVLLLANGKRKEDAVADALLMEPDCSVPISYGHVLSQKGGNMVFVIDRFAAGKALEKADQIRKRGIELENLSEQAASVSVASLQFSRDPESGHLS